MFRAHGVCYNLINALKHLAHQQKDCDSPVKTVVQGLEERSRLKMMDELTRFMMVDNFETVQVGDLDKNMESKKVVKPKFTTDFPEAVTREGADELTLRAEEAGMLRTFMDTTDVGDSRWVPPLVDEDWHAICQAVFQGVDGSEWEAMCNTHKELHQAVHCETSRENKKARALWPLERSKRTKE